MASAAPSRFWTASLNWSARSRRMSGGIIPPDVLRVPAVLLGGAVGGAPRLFKESYARRQGTFLLYRGVSSFSEPSGRGSQTVRKHTVSVLLTACFPRRHF